MAEANISTRRPYRPDQLLSRRRTAGVVVDDVDGRLLPGAFIVHATTVSFVVPVHRAAED